MTSSVRIDDLQRKYEENPRRYFAPLASELRRAGQARRAVELCEAGLAADPGHLSGHVVLAQALVDLGDRAGAERSFARAIELDSENLVALRSLGDLARDRGEREAARGWYQHALEADPRDPELATRLSTLDGASAAPVDAGAAPAAVPATPVAADPPEPAQQPERTADAAPPELSPAVPAFDEALAREFQQQREAEEFTAGFFAALLEADRAPDAAPTVEPQPERASAPSEVGPPASSEPVAGEDELPEGGPQAADAPTPVNALEAGDGTMDRPREVTIAERAPDVGPDEPEFLDDLMEFRTESDSGSDDSAPTVPADAAEPAPGDELAGDPEADRSVTPTVHDDGEDVLSTSVDLVESGVDPQGVAGPDGVARGGAIGSATLDDVPPTAAGAEDAGSVTTSEDAPTDSPSAHPVREAPSAAQWREEIPQAPWPHEPAAERPTSEMPVAQWSEETPTGQPDDESESDAQPGNALEPIAQASVELESVAQASDELESAAHSIDEPSTVAQAGDEPEPGERPTDEATSDEQPAAAPPDEWLAVGAADRPTVEEESSRLPFVTVTMGTLLLQQGFREDALQIFRQLAAQHPDDSSIRDQVARLESELEPADESGDAVTVGSWLRGLAHARPVVAAGSEGDVTGQGIAVPPATVPTEPVEQPEPAPMGRAGADDRPADVALPATDLLSSAAAAAASAVTWESGEAGAGIDDLFFGDDPLEWGEVAAPPTAADVPPVDDPAADLTLDQLFGRPVPADEEMAAGALATATLAMQGDDEMDARLAEASAEDPGALDHLLAPPEAVAPARQTGSFSFEQFFQPETLAGDSGPAAVSGSAAPASAAPSAASPAAATPGDDEEAAAREADLADFHAWLAGLSKS